MNIVVHKTDLLTNVIT